MDNGAKGCELVISGKMGVQRAKSMKFRAGYMIKSGDAVNHYVDYAVRHLQLKQVSIISRFILHIHIHCSIREFLILYSVETMIKWLPKREDLTILSI
jgi:hypothetical protein